MILIFLSTLIFVFFKALQQQQVVSGMYLRVVPTSFCMAFCEVAILLLVVKAGTMWAFIPMGTAGALGACAAMWIHRRYVR